MILIVDDEPWYLFAIKDILSLEGFDVYTATTVSECLEMLTKPDDIEILILDVVMPPGSLNLNDTQRGFKTGLVLLNKIREISPKLPVVLFSISMDLNSDWSKDSNTIVVSKADTSPSELVSIIRRLTLKLEV